MTPADWRTGHPDVFFLDPADVAGLTVWLEHAGVLTTDERVVSVAKAGDGNMNCTVRVVTGRRSIIVKQARPWVEKYPQFAAPWDRAVREMEFFDLGARHPEIASRLPQVLHTDAAARALVLADLGRGGDYTDVYRGGVLLATDVESLADWLSALHHNLRGTADRRGLANREMRALNHAHIFRIPLEPENGLDLDAITPGLASAAAGLRNDRAFVAAVTDLEGAYLADGPCLLHGDFFPGSWLRTPEGPKIIDPEFAYFGRPEFDGAVFLAHLLLAHQPAALAGVWLACYRPPPESDERVMLQLAGVEVMRRLIGYAQLPLAAGRAEKVRLLALARELVVAPSRDLLQ